MTSGDVGAPPGLYTGEDKHKNRLGLALVAAAFSAPAVAAPSVGDTITCTSFDFDCAPGVSPVAITTVSGSPEFTLYQPGTLFPELSADFANNVLTLTNVSGTSFQSQNATISFRDTTSPFTVANFDASNSSGFTNFGQSNLTLLCNNSLRIQFSNNTTTLDSNAVLTIAFAPLAAAVPEPASWAMMILGLGGVGYALRRRQQATARVRLV